MQHKNLTKIKAAVVPIMGEELSPEETALFKKYNPLGYILFGRNYRDPKQIKQLTDRLKEIADREDILVLIDQEGERVARLRTPHFTVLDNAVNYGDMYEADPEGTIKSLRRDFTVVGSELRAVGININCAPVADFYHQFADPIIGIRSYGSDVEKIVRLCDAVDNGLANSKVQSVVKHMPGHGRALEDSHFTLPVIKDSINELISSDFEVFKRLSDKKMSMTAHVLIRAIDEINPVTLSSKAIQYIRQDIGFQGVIITDALDMKALQGNLEDITKAASNAGCDILLYCKPSLQEIDALLDNCHYLTDDIANKIHKFNCF